MTDADLPARSRERVADWLAEVRERYDCFERVEKRWELAPEAYERDRDRIAAGENGGAGIWVTNDGGEVLLVRNEGDEGWGDPGGKREAGESFETAARREVREETAVEATITGVREVHVLELADESDPDRPALASLIVIFDGRCTGGDPRPREGEIRAVEWFASPPERVLYPEVADRPYPASE
ncbi:NUDIX hydrolase [Halosimplex litoreum]|uniref:NUDIX hydrolase n=1 Tax=Halosimplex litoreum TaxID=1198301 RepID=A0A7T3FZB9_9EURY|nr:NUDIX hydrolase [Halosimplex litoreum]QPV63500.1 NUDIX hydrolase [Halosimplex litoreum]